MSEEPKKRGRDLRRKVKKTTEAITECRFKVDTQKFVSALNRVSGMLTLGQVKPEDQNVVVRANDKGKVIIECGSSGSYCSVTIPAEVAQPGYFSTAITIPAQIRYGADSVLFTTDPENKKILYSSRIRGHFVSTATPDATFRNRPKPDTKPGMVRVPRESFSRVYYASYFNADVLEDNPDVLVRFDIAPLDKKFKVGKQVRTHSIKVTVHDLHRAAYSVDMCGDIEGKATGVFQASTMWRFLKSCYPEEEFISVGSTNTSIWIETESCTSVSPTIHGEVRDIESWARNFHKDEAYFQFTVDTDTIHQALREVASIHDRNPDSERRLCLESRKGQLQLSMESSIGSAQQRIDVHKGTSGKIDVDADFLVNSLSLFKSDNAPAFFTVWDSAMSMEVAGSIKSTHFFSTMAQQ